MLYFSDQPGAGTLFAAYQHLENERTDKLARAFERGGSRSGRKRRRDDDDSDY